jgi:hypothetical protein
MNGLLNILTSLAFSISLIFVMPSGQAHAQNAAPALVVSPTTVAPGGLITVSWQAPSTHSDRDWIGLFRADMPSAGTTKIASTYVPSGTSGTMTFTAPNTLIRQTYQLRYLLNDGYQEVVRSATITVTSAIDSTPQPTTSSTAPSAPTTYSVNASQITVAPGAALTVTWQAPSTHSSKDWIGLFLANMPSAGNTIISYKYVPSGTGGVLTFTAPTTPFPQTYQLRYLVNDGYTETARSAAITVSSAGISTTPSAPSPAPTPTPVTSPTTTSPTINAPSTSSPTLTWIASTSSDVAGYKVYRATASGAYGAPIVTLQGNATKYIATGLQTGTTYFFVVTAFDNAGNESLHSNEVSKSIY